LAPIIEKLNNILEQIASDENLTIIFDGSNSGIMWAQERLNITQQVIMEMNRQAGRN
jgi:Skp family chaperone for outer membrane proteins